MARLKRRPTPQVIKQPPVGWIPGNIVSLIATIITITILTIEIRRRKSQKHQFTTKSLQYSSLFCIISGIIPNIFFFINEYDGFCYFSTLIANIFYPLTTIFMGFYQLSRLHYCFANDKIHSNKGYPKWLFIIMIIIGISLIINWPLSLIIPGYFNLINSKCGINSKFEYYFVPVKTFSFKYPYAWMVATASCYFVWDITTFLLYYYKIHAFRHLIKDKDQGLVYKRILSILYKIFILTMFYEIFTLIALVIGLAGNATQVGDRWVRPLVRIIAFS